VIVPALVAGDSKREHGWWPSRSRGFQRSGRYLRFWARFAAGRAAGFAAVRLTGVVVRTVREALAGARLAGAGRFAATARFAGAAALRRGGAAAAAFRLFGRAGGDAGRAGVFGATAFTGALATTFTGAFAGGSALAATFAGGFAGSTLAATFTGAFAGGSALAAAAGGAFGVAAGLAAAAGAPALPGAGAFTGSGAAGALAATGAFAPFGAAAV